MPGQRSIPGWWVDEHCRGPMSEGEEATRVIGVMEGSPNETPSTLANEPGADGG